MIIVLVIVWRRKQKYIIAHTDSYNGSVTETKLRSLTVTSDALSSHFGGPLNSDSTRSTAPIYSVNHKCKVASKFMMTYTLQHAAWTLLEVVNIVRLHGNRKALQIVS